MLQWKLELEFAERRRGPCSIGVHHNQAQGSALQGGPVCPSRGEPLLLLMNKNEDFYTVEWMIL